MEVNRMADKEYQYITMKRIGESESGLTGLWHVKNSRDKTLLGTIRWHGPWRQYCFFPNPFGATVFSAGCLKDIVSFTKSRKIISIRTE
jgi:hypothetical protein